VKGIGTAEILINLKLSAGALSIYPDFVAIRSARKYRILRAPSVFPPCSSVRSAPALIIGLRCVFNSFMSMPVFPSGINSVATAVPRRSTAPGAEKTQIFALCMPPENKDFLEYPATEDSFDHIRAIASSSVCPGQWKTLLSRYLMFARNRPHPALSSACPSAPSTEIVGLRVRQLEFRPEL
jgi:hypothetical protein